MKVDQRVTFTVDAFPEDNFEGKITQIRLNPTVSSNVVTYKVIVEAPNPDLKLMPGLTASISVITKEAKDVLVISTKALHFIPDQAVTEEFFPKPTRNIKIPDGKGVGLDSSNSDNMPNPGALTSTQTATSNNENMVWIKTGKIIQPKMVKTGLGDGVSVEIKDGLHEGDSVVTSSTKVLASSTNNAAAQSPFMPKMPQRNRKN